MDRNTIYKTAWRYAAAREELAQRCAGPGRGDVKAAQQEVDEARTDFCDAVDAAFGERTVDDGCAAKRDMHGAVGYPGFGVKAPTGAIPHEAASQIVAGLGNAVALRAARSRGELSSRTPEQLRDRLRTYLEEGGHEAFEIVTYALEFVMAQAGANARRPA